MLRGRKSSNSNKSSKAEPRNQFSDSASFDGIGWVGPITLRRRAKPELESERYRDITLRLSVQEVKNLTSKGRYFCEVRLDRTLYARTTSKLGEFSVFWGEKFDLNNLPAISIMTIHLFKQAGSTKEKRSRSKCQNQFVAYVTIPLSDLTQSCESQQWLTMQPPQVPGLELTKREHEARLNSPAASRFRKRSVPVPRSFVSNGFTDEAATGEATKKKNSWSTEQMARTEAVTKVHSANASISASDSCLPQIRLSLFYETIDVLPLDCYAELSEFIQTNYLPLIRFLEPRLSAKQKEELASCFVNIHEKHPDFSLPDFLADLLREDLRQTNDPSMIFRSNSTGSKAVECYVKLVASEYLHDLLKSFVDQMLTSEADFELDPARLGAPEIGDRNRLALVQHASALLRRITNSHANLPPELRAVFSALSGVLSETHGAEAAARLISSCLFLRFICPAIHGPVLFGLTSAVPESTRVSRNLTLLAKVLQNLANLSPFQDKEPHMKTLNPFISQEIPAMHAFLQAISTVTESGGQLRPAHGCHNFIDLGYEFAKLTNLLKAHLSGVEIPEELCALTRVLKFIHEHTTDAVLSSWTPGIVASRKLSAPAHTRATPQHHQNDHRPQNHSATQLDKLSLGEMSTENGADENLDELICQYREQLRQLNACIDRVNPTPRNSSSPPTADCEDVFGTSDYEEPDECSSEPVQLQQQQQQQLPESPSLDQLAERLQELRLLVQSERAELEEVLANKTRAMQQQEQSIEQLASEVDQLKQHRRDLTLSPSSSSFSSEDPVLRCGLSNLLDLSRASEGTGIPLGELIVAKHQPRRRFSESPLNNNNNN